MFKKLFMFITIMSLLFFSNMNKTFAYNDLKKESIINNSSIMKKINKKQIIIIKLIDKKSRIIKGPKKVIVPINSEFKSKDLISHLAIIDPIRLKGIKRIKIKEDNYLGNEKHEGKYKVIFSLENINQIESTYEVEIEVKRNLRNIKYILDNKFIFLETQISYLQLLPILKDINLIKDVNQTNYNMITNSEIENGPLVGFNRIDITEKGTNKDIFVYTKVLGHKKDEKAKKIANKKKEEFFKEPLFYIPLVILGSLTIIVIILYLVNSKRKRIVV